MTEKSVESYLPLTYIGEIQELSQIWGENVTEISLIKFKFLIK